MYDYLGSLKITAHNTKVDFKLLIKTFDAYNLEVYLKTYSSF